MKNLCSLLFFGFIISCLHAQPVMEWQKSFGGTQSERPQSIAQTMDGGYILVGSTHSINGDVTSNQGGDDLWIIKLSATGSLAWQKTYGGSYDDFGYSIQETNDGGYIVLGSTISNDGDVVGNHGKTDLWILKINNVGVLQWQKTLGGSEDDYAAQLQKTMDGGYVIAGITGSNDGDIAENHGALDFWVIKVNAIGDIAWQKTYGGSSVDFLFSIQPTIEGGYILGGQTASNDGDISVNHGIADCWVVKISDLGVIEWQRTYGGSDYEYGGTVVQTSDLGYIIAASTYSSDGDVSENHGVNDVWIIKCDGGGDIQWEKTIGGSDVDECNNSIKQTNSGKFIVAGYTQSVDGDVSGMHGSGDCWLILLSEEGALEWQKPLGGSSMESGIFVDQTNEGGYIMAAWTLSNNGDVTVNHGGEDIWLVKFAPDEVNIKDLPSVEALDIFPNPATTNAILKTSVEESSLAVTISDLQGRQISKQTIPKEGKLEVSSLDNGVYAIVATTRSGKIYANKLTIQK